MPVVDTTQLARDPPPVKSAEAGIPWGEGSVRFDRCCINADIPMLHRSAYPGSRDMAGWNDRLQEVLYGYATFLKEKEWVLPSTCSLPGSIAWTLSSRRSTCFWPKSADEWARSPGNFRAFRQVRTSHRFGGLWIMDAGELRSAWMNSREPGRGPQRACTEPKAPLTPTRRRRSDPLPPPSLPAPAMRSPALSETHLRRPAPILPALLCSPWPRQHVMESGAERRTPKRPYGPRMGCRSREWQQSTGALPPHRRMPNRLSRVLRKSAIAGGGSRFGVRRFAPLSHSVPNASGQ